MSKIAINEIRENRIGMGVSVLDVFDEEELAMSWYYYLIDMIRFPFIARCIAENRISPLVRGELVKVTSMASEKDCLSEMFVEIMKFDQIITVPLSQLKAHDAEDETREAIEDWHYWIGRGYTFQQI